MIFVANLVSFVIQLSGCDSCQKQIGNIFLQKTYTHLHRETPNEIWRLVYRESKIITQPALTISGGKHHENLGVV